MHKNKIEDICRRAGMVPATRARMHDAEVFIADGFSPHPAISFRKFGIEPGDFPGGCYATLWWVSKGEDQLNVGQPMFFELLHNPELTGDGKKQARINAAKVAAGEFLAAWKRKRAMH